MQYRELEHSGLKISGLTLGSANFGTHWGAHWSLSKRTAEEIFRAALDAGINAIDTANIYNRGESERWIGEFAEAAGVKHDIIISTKFGYRTTKVDGGSGRVSMFSAVDKSLQRLRRDVIDILYLQIWDCVTPIEETVGAAFDLIGQGKLRHFALSNVPAWYLARADAISKGSGLGGIPCVQLNYNLLSRQIEHDFHHLLSAIGTGLIAWGPLADGLLSGRYVINPSEKSIEGEGRLNGGAFQTSDINPYSLQVSSILTEVRMIAERRSRTPSQIALAWLQSKSAVASTVIGVSSVSQLADCVDSVDLRLNPDELARLDELSRIKFIYPNNYQDEHMQAMVHGY